jgi:hypothetical protein
MNSELLQLSPLLSPVRSSELSPELSELSPLKLSPEKYASNPSGISTVEQAKSPIVPVTPKRSLDSLISNSTVSVYGGLRKIGNVSEDLIVGFSEMQYKGWHSGPKSERRNVKYKEKRGKTSTGVLCTGLKEKKGPWNAEVAPRAASGHLGDIKLIAMRDIIDQDDNSMCTEEEWQQILKARETFERKYATVVEKNVTPIHSVVLVVYPLLIQLFC